MGNYVRNCTQTLVRVSKFAHAHDHVSQKVCLKCADTRVVVCEHSHEHVS